MPELADGSAGLKDAKEGEKLIQDQHGSQAFDYDIKGSSAQKTSLDNTQFPTETAADEFSSELFNGDDCLFFGTNCANVR